MGKKTKSTSAAKSRWKQLEKDFEGEKKLVSSDAIFEEATTEEFRAHILEPLLKSDKSFADVVSKLVEWREYLSSRSSRLCEELCSKIKTEYESIHITLSHPFNESLWQELETVTETDLNKIPILINGVRTTTVLVISTLKRLVKEFQVTVKNSQIFPFDVDSFGLPPINCKKIWNPLIWLRLEIEKVIKENGQCDEPCMNQLVTSLNQAPRTGQFDKIAVTSFFLEKTADNLNYSNRNNKEQFIEDLKSLFGSTKVNELTMVLPDILIAYSEELVERVMQVSYFIPYELFRLIFLCWQPKVLKLCLRSEACTSIEDAARIEWDDEEVFTSTTLFNCPLFDRCEPVCLGNEAEIIDCKLIVDASGSRLFDPVYNEKNADTAGRDFLCLFPMKTLLIKRKVSLKNGASIKTQLKQHIEFIVNTFFWNVEEHQERVINFELTFTNAKEVQMGVVKKGIPQSSNGRKIGVNFDVEQTTKNLFAEFGNASEGRHLYSSFFDAQNQVILDLKIILAE